MDGALRELREASLVTAVSNRSCRLNSQVKPHEATLQKPSTALILALIGTIGDLDSQIQPVGEQI